jgi:hypothetical protein
MGAERFIAISTGRAAPLFLSLLLFAVWFDARSLAKKVEDGEAARPSFFLDYGIRVERATLRWTDRPPRSLRNLSSHKLMLLSRSGDTVFLYDVHDHRTLQIPSSIVAVSINR